MCKLCWDVVEDQDKEDTKQAFHGHHCARFSCWEWAEKPFGTSVAHREQPRGVDLSRFASRVDSAERAARSRSPMWTLIQEADSEELRRIITTAADRLANMANDIGCQR